MLECSLPGAVFGKEGAAIGTPISNSRPLLSLPAGYLWMGDGPSPAGGSCEDVRREYASVPDAVR